MKAPYLGISTYFARVNSLSPIAAATDIFTLSGSASKSVEIIEFSIYGTATALAALNVQALTRSTANAGGTLQTDAVIGTYDFSDPIQTAVVRYQNSGSNPTVGTLASTILSGTLNLPASAGTDKKHKLSYGTSGESSIVLTGTSEYFVLNLAGQTIPSGTSLNLEVIWQEK